ncbi:hypothetical protein M8818_004348 [Zalaria obscura]|uniref:Uncharacterized protein n=1 Tax=Zalaria obscura TaxID=2024903 RepID=A0ACC3SAV6_9PEZI
MRVDCDEVLDLNDLRDVGVRGALPTRSSFDSPLSVTGEDRTGAEALEVREGGALCWVVSLLDSRFLRLRKIKNIMAAMTARALTLPNTPPKTDARVDTGPRPIASETGAVVNATEAEVPLITVGTCPSDGTAVTTPGRDAREVDPVLPLAVLLRVVLGSVLSVLAPGTIKVEGSTTVVEVQ